MPELKRDGWYRIQKDKDPSEWEFVEEQTAEAEILARGGEDLMHFTFGIAAPQPTIEEFKKCLRYINERFAADLPFGFKFNDYEESNPDAQS